MIQYKANNIPNYIPIYENPLLDDDQILYLDEEGCLIASIKMYKLVKLSILNRERKDKLNKIIGS